LFDILLNGLTGVGEGGRGSVDSQENVRKAIYGRYYPFAFWDLLGEIALSLHRCLISGFSY
jgi:hypothetical protein